MMMLRRATAVLALTSLLSAGLPLPAAAAPDATPFPILFVTQVPIPYDFTTIGSVFGNHLTAMDSVGRGGDLWIRYPDGTLKNLTALAGYGVASGFQGRRAIAVREPSVHWSGTKALFSMVIGAPPQQYQYVTRYWQIYEVTGLGVGDTPVITKVPNQPADLQQRQPDLRHRTTASSSRPTGRATAPRTSTRSSTSTRRRRPSPASGASIAATGDLRLLDHAPSGDFTPIVDSFGRVVFTRWDHLQRDQQADADAIGGGVVRDLQLLRRSGRRGRACRPRDEVFPEPRAERVDLLAGTNLEGHSFNHFFPWMINEDGTELEALNHVGRHELHRYFNRSINDDANVREFIAETSGPVQPERDRGDAADQGEPGHRGALLRHRRARVRHARVRAGGRRCRASRACTATRSRSPTTRTARRRATTATGSRCRPATRATTATRCRSPTARVLVVHTPETRADRNDGTRALPVSRYDFRLKLLQPGPGGFRSRARR